MQNTFQIVQQYFTSPTLSPINPTEEEEEELLRGTMYSLVLLLLLLPMCLDLRDELLMFSHVILREHIIITDMLHQSEQTTPAKAT